jgi:aspartyl-tRNA(Asn)/glutamyl-tRNA(Gln) amidotransferase subunit A
MPMDALSWASIGELGRILRAGETTAVKMAEHFLDRLERIGPKFNAVATLTRDRALEEARRADTELQTGRDRGPLHGIPYGAKDLLAVKGYPTAWGARPLQEQTFDEDAAVIERLGQAGAVLCAKLAMVELAGGFGYQQADAAFTGPGRNAWDAARWSGGSSSGSGSAVAAGLVPFAIGSETSGSIITPSCYNGLSGFRPTFGRVSKRGAMALSWSLDRLGPMCRSAADCRLVLRAIEGFDPEDACSLKPPETKAPPHERRFRFAKVKRATTNLQPEVQNAFEESLRTLEAIGDFVEIELPDLPFGAVVGTIIACETAAAFESFLASGKSWELTAPEDRWGAHSGLMIPAVDYIQAQRIRRIGQRAMDRLLTDIDAIVSPTLATVAGPIEQRFAEWSKGFVNTPVSGAGTASGLPALTAPNGFSTDGLPTGLQLLGRAWNDDVLLTIGEKFQAQTEWHQRHPEVD